MWRAELPGGGGGGDMVGRGRECVCVGGGSKVGGRGRESKVGGGGGAMRVRFEAGARHLVETTGGHSIGREHRPDLTLSPLIPTPLLRQSLHMVDSLF